MSPPILLVPGTGGTQLLKNGTTLGHPVVVNAKLWLLKTVGVDVEQTVLDMSMEHAPGQIQAVRTTLAPGSEVRPGSILKVAYNLILPHAQTIYNYDWREDIEVSAQGLIKVLKAEYGGVKAHIVSHSQGGLVVVAASKLMARQGLAMGDYVARIDFVGVPIYGTLNAAHGLLVGENLGEKAESEFRKIGGTWPSLYEMLPSWYALRDPNGQISRYSFFHKKTWEPYPWIKPHLVKRAWQVRRDLLNHPADSLQGIAFRFILTKNRKTWDHAIRQNDGTITFPEPSVAGDSLVPFTQTYNQMHDVEQQRVHAVGPQENVPEHSFLLTDDWIVSLIRGAH